MSTNNLNLLYLRQLSTNVSMNNKYKVLSLFCGCGGMDLGFLGDFEYLNEYYAERKFEIVWANDLDEKACLTYENNFKVNHVFCGDIWEILKSEEKLATLPKENDVDIVIGGFPCQDFSHAGKRLGFENKKRGTLYKSMCEIIKQKKPKLFVAENVRGLLTIDNGQAIRTIIEDFKKIGYHVEYQLYHAADYGVPQSRERVVIVGTNKDLLPPFEHSKLILSKKDYRTLKQAIGDLENKKEGSVPNHHWSKAKMFAGTQGNSTVDANKIGPTMRAEHHGNIEWHWNGKRRLSAREAARIQTFPDNFIFYPSTSAAYKQIGNAVPPVLAWHIAQSIENFLEKYLNHDLYKTDRSHRSSISGTFKIDKRFVTEKV